MFAEHQKQIPINNSLELPIMKRFLFLVLPVLVAMPCHAQLNYPPTKTVDASDTYFDIRNNSLATHGVVIAFAHVRGGGEKGEA